VKQKLKIISKLIATAWIIFFFTGCADRFLIKKSDFLEINQKLALLEEQLEKQINSQSDGINLLTNNQKNNKTLINRAIEENNLNFKLIENQLAQNHDSTSKKLITIDKSIKDTNLKLKEIAKNPETKDKDEKPSLKISPTHKLLIGKVEKVRLSPPNKVFHARIDTGATTSSLDAQDIETFERDGSSWVRFKIKDPTGYILYDLEKPVVRKAKIKQASTDEASKRPVVELQFQIGNIKRIEEFTLEDRSHLDFQILIGRNILRDLMIVDVAQEFIIPLPEEKESRKQIP